jgi:predicted dehydrogenase
MSGSNNVVRVLCVGAGHMGRPHALAYQALAGVEVCGVVTRSAESRAGLVAELGGAVAGFDDFHQALEATRPDAVCISTYPDSHAEFAGAALAAGCHVFIEKPLAESVADAQRLVELAAASRRKLVVGYILRHHPSWEKFIGIARTLGKPLVMRMNLNQQSSGANWGVHQKLLASVSPVVDCGVHYVDVMCQMTRARPLRVSGIGARLSEDLPAGQFNYGQLQVTFDDGSVGWYEAGWGPMMSEVAFFVKDVVGPNGSVSIVAEAASAAGQSANIDAHTATQSLRVHHAALSADGSFARADELIELVAEPDHNALCLREQEYFLRAIREDLDLTEHLQDAVSSLRIVLAADESFRTGRTVEL